MREHLVIGACASGLVVAAVMSLTAGSAQAACLKNEAGRNLYAIMSSNQGRLERNLSIGAEICQQVAKGTAVKVNLLPYGGARFGCRMELTGAEKSIVVRFNTMNKCDFIKGN